MTAKTNFTEERTLDFWLNANTLSTSAPANIEISLLTADPGETGSTAAEVVGNGYTRVQGVAWTVTVNVAQNTGAINFPQASGGSWGLITFVGIHDQGTGTMLFKGQLAAAKQVDDLDTISFAAGALTITED